MGGFFTRISLSNTDINTPQYQQMPKSTIPSKSKFKGSVNVKGKGKLVYKKCTGHAAANTAILKAGKSRYM